MKTSLTDRHVTAMHGELKALHARVWKLILVRVLAASHKLEKINHLRLLEKLRAWREKYGFDRTEVQSLWQHRSQGQMCPVNVSKHCQVNV